MKLFLVLDYANCKQEAVFFSLSDAQRYIKANDKSTETETCNYVIFSVDAEKHPIKQKD